MIGKYLLLAVHLVLIAIVVYCTYILFILYMSKDSRSQNRNVILLALNVVFNILTGWATCVGEVNMFVNLVRSVSFYNIYLMFTILTVNSVNLMDNRNKAAACSTLTEVFWLIAVVFTIYASEDLDLSELQSSHKLYERVCLSHYTFSSVQPAMFIKAYLSTMILLPAFFVDTKKPVVYISICTILMCIVFNAIGEVYSQHLLTGIITRDSLAYQMVFNPLNVAAYFIELCGLVSIVAVYTYICRSYSSHKELQSTIYSLLMDFDVDSPMYKSNCYKAGKISKNIGDTDIKKLLKRVKLDSTGVFYFNKGRNGESFIV